MLWMPSIALPITRSPQGTSATTFSPNSSVLRWQMALFLTRTVTALGVALPNGAGQGFTDIGSMPAATQTAINQIRQLGISLGTSATSFNPLGVVPRWQMALFLSRLLSSGRGLASQRRQPGLHRHLGHAGRRRRSRSTNFASSASRWGQPQPDLLAVQRRLALADGALPGPVDRNRGWPSVPIGGGAASRPLLRPRALSP